MAEQYKPNKLLDKAPYDDGRAEPEYPWVRGEQDLLGNRVITYADPENPDQAFIERIKYDGSFTINEANGLKNEFNKEVRSYTSGGDSHNTDGQKAVYGQSNFNLAFKQDVGFTAGGTTYKGSGEKEIGGTAQGSFQNDTGGNTRIFLVAYSFSGSDVGTTTNMGNTFYFVLGGGNHQFYTGLDVDVERMRISNNGNVLINNNLRISRTTGFLTP
jgi:hypothetical protein